MGDLYDVIIVGGGVAGLISAHKLLKERSNLKLLVIEASDQVCGVMKTVELRSPNGKDYFDIGVSRVGSAQPIMLGLLKEFGLETYEHFDKGTKHWQLPDGKVKTYSGSIPPLPYTALVDLLRYFKKMDKLAAQIGKAKSTEECAEWDNTTVEDFMNKFLWMQGAKDMAATMVGTFCGMAPSKLSMTEYLSVIHSCGSWERHIGGEGTGRMDLQLKGGFRQLADRLEESVGKERIVLGDAVVRVEQAEDRSRATIRTKSGKEYQAKRVVMAIPSPNIDKLELIPGLPVPRTLAIGSYGVHFIATYQKNFWREKKQAGELLSMSGTLASFKDDREHPIIALFDTSTPSGSPALFGIFGAPSFATLSMDERKAIALDFMVNILGKEARDILDYTDVCWSQDEKGKEPIAAEVQPKPSEVIGTIKDPLGCIHFAGEDTGNVWAGMMECAADSAVRVVKEVLKAV
ncbi:amine oxidase [flavin-containing] A-like [Diadema setosum]|uniref:amine oxidase [flavin-containing] A-like n=1 Tax=Diadema setosum TaxID=31175 RepID=UPI003B3B596E